MVKNTNFKIAVRQIDKDIYNNLQDVHIDRFKKVIDHLKQGKDKIEFTN